MATKAARKTLATRYGEFIRRVTEDTLDIATLDIWGTRSRQRANQIKAALGQEGILALYRLVAGYNTGFDHQLVIWTKPGPKGEVRMCVIPYADRELLKIEASREKSPRERKIERGER